MTDSGQQQVEITDPHAVRLVSDRAKKENLSLAECAARVIINHLKGKDEQDSHAPTRSPEKTND
jgi:hypothetical protein